MPQAARSVSGRRLLHSRKPASHPVMLSFDPSGQPFNTLYGDVYKSRAGALAEARQVFVAGARVVERWHARDRFTIVELGFGLGVNFLATLAAWRSDPGRCARLHFVSVEGHPLPEEDLSRAHAALGIAGPDALRLRARWPVRTPGLHRIEFDEARVTLTVAIGDVATVLPRLAVAADAFYLDGFAPDRNPAMWSEPSMKRLARIANPGATLATYSCAARVRESLAAAGFATEPLPGFGTKRQRLAGAYAPRWHTYPAPPEPIRWASRDALVVGGGIAGCATACALARRGWRVRLLERRAQVACEGSGQQAIADHLHVSPDDNPLARLTRAALLSATAPGQSSSPDRAGAAPGAADRSTSGAAAAALRRTGRLMIADDEEELRRHFATADRLRFPDSMVRALDRQQASDVAGVAVRNGGLWLPMCRTADPAALCSAWLARAAGGVEVHNNAPVARLERADSQWTLLDPHGRELGRAPLIVLANAGDAWRLAGARRSGLRRVRGQTTVLDAALLPGLRTVLGGDAYACPLPDGRVLAGSTFDDGDSLVPEAHADLSNLRRLARLLDVTGTSDDWAERAAQACSSGATGFRFVARDRLPLIGPMPDHAAVLRQAPDLIRNARLPIPVLPGLYGAFGYGSRGLLWSTLGAESIAAAVESEPEPIEADLRAAIEPGRFLRHELRRGRRPG